MMPRPTSTKPATTKLPPSSIQHGRAPVRLNQSQDQHVSRDRSQTVMGPPPTPQPQAQRQALESSLQRTQMGLVSNEMQSNTNSSRRAPLPLTASNRFIPARSQRFAAPTPTDHRFVPLMTSTGPHQFTASSASGSGSGSRVPPISVFGSRAPSRAATSSMSGGGQRMPFVPGAADGFG